MGKKRYVARTGRFFRLIISISIISLLFSMLSALALAEFYTIATPFNTSHPIINVTYFEQPVTALTYNLTDVNYGVLWRLQNLTGFTNRFNFSFKSIDYLDNGDYLFWITSTDADGNIDTTGEEFEIDHSGMPVWLISPPVGIGQTRVYEITIGSRFDATCRWDTTLFDCTGQTQELSCIYDHMQNTFQHTGGTIHTTMYTSPPTAGVYLNITYICKIVGAANNDDASFGKTHSMSGYDDQPIHILSIASDPATIFDKHSPVATVNVITDKPAVCNITGNNGNVAGSTGYGMASTNSLFSNENQSVYTSYSTNHSFTLDYYSVREGYNKIDFLYNIKCYSLSQLTDTKPLIIKYDLNNSIAITKITPESEYVQDLNPTFVISTNLVVSYCSLSLNGKDLGEMAYDGKIKEGDYRFHTDLPDINPGSNTVSVTCAQESASTTQDFPLIYDDQAPILTLVAKPNACSLNGITFHVNASDAISGINHINYIITGPSEETLADKNITSGGDITENIALTNNSDYTITATAYDNAGNPSDPVPPQPIHATSPDDVSCDSIPPVLKLSVKYIGAYNYQANVTVNCTDDRGSCQDTFAYYFGNYDLPCNYSVADQDYIQSSLSDGLPIFDPDIVGSSKTRLCVIVYDDNQNNDTAEVQIAMTPRICGNDIIEDGEDCEGNDLNELSCQSLTIIDDASPYVGQKYINGTLRCNPPGTDDQCKFDTTNCNAWAGYCGDNKINNFPNEQCDGNGASKDWGKITGCSSLGFKSGSLSCNPPYSADQCQFNTSLCTGWTNLAPHCSGNTLSSTLFLDPGEQCEHLLLPLNVSCSSFDSLYGPNLGCTPNCQFDISGCTQPPKCGDGNKDASIGEECDSNEVIECSDLNSTRYISGNATCNPPDSPNQCHYDTSNCVAKPYCGNNIVEPKNDEQCDGTALSGLSCHNFKSTTYTDGYPNGTLSCGQDCTFDISNCNRGNGFCGDNITNNQGKEQCDGNGANKDWGKITSCTDFNFTGGTLRCDNCIFNTTACTPATSNPVPGCTGGDLAILDSGEQCEDGMSTKINCTWFDHFIGGPPLTCTTDKCILDISQCTLPTPPAICGDGIFDPTAEDCEGTAQKACIDINSELYSGGNATCYQPGTLNECQYDISKCDIKPSCGNNKREIGELCDGTDLAGFTCHDFKSTTYSDGYPNGTLSCGIGCDSFNIDNCNKGAGYCGDNITNNQGKEQCDGNGAKKDWGKITSCTDFNFTGGTLRCDNCIFNTTACTPAKNNPIPGCTGGSTAILDSGEQCEDGMSTKINCTWFDHFIEGPPLTCTGNTCILDISQCQTPIPPAICGDGLIENDKGEECEGASQQPCTNISDIYSGGTATCNPKGSANQCQYDISQCKYKPFCGNNVKDAGELCDGTDLAGLSCHDFKSATYTDGYPNGTLSCGIGCDSFNIDNCNKGAGYCGDNITNNQGKEQCDGNGANKDWGKITSCTDFGFTSGTLKCDNCIFNTTACTPATSNPAPSCTGGDLAILDSGEQCEDGMSTKINCTWFDHFIEGPPLTCTTDKCILDISQCTLPTPPTICGDGTVDAGEDCEGSTQTPCTEISDIYSGGTATCNPKGSANQCKYDISQCTYHPFCGNNKRETGELCDGTDLAGFTCKDFSDYTAGTLSCSEGCNSFNIDNCDRGSGYCGDNKINNYNNEQCDGNGANKDWGKITSCTDFGFKSGTLTCDGCQFNTTGCTPKLNNPLPGCTGGSTAILDKGEQCEDTIATKLNCSWFDSFTGGSTSCDNCMINIEACTAPVQPAICGDGTIDPTTEDCEGTTQKACTEISDIYSGGNATCRSCKYDLTQCKFQPFCGNNVTDTGEACDGPSLKAYNGQIISCSNFNLSNGELKCDKGCKWDTSNCNNGNGWCGNNKIDEPNSGGQYEQCDGNGANKDWGKITRCQDFGFTGGTLKCDNCIFNTTGCYQANPNPNPTCGTDNNGVSTLDSSEQCDINHEPLNCSWFDSFGGGDISCDSSCSYDISSCIAPAKPAVCGDGIVEADELCEGNETKSCNEFPGYEGGTARCIPSSCKFDFSACEPVPECGNSNIEGTEQCDRTKLGGMTCSKIGSFQGGILGCYLPGATDECLRDTSRCDLGAGYCGDNQINNNPNELCDGTDYGNIPKGRAGCLELGFDGGTLSCSACWFNTSLCTINVVKNPICGDGVLDPGEDCEPSRPLAVNCTDVGHYAGGDLSCGSDCRFNTDACTLPTVPSCGDGIINNNEQCDGDVLGTITDCTQISSRYFSGALTCGSNCMYNSSSCVLKQPVCGNSIREKGEMCDGTNIGSLSCSDFGLSGGDLGCDSYCQADTSMCTGTNGSENICGNAIIDPGETCDGTNLGTSDWRSIMGCDGTVSCSSCQLECSSSGGGNPYECPDATDIGCGGSCPACGNGKMCVQNSDCLIGKCTNYICSESTGSASECTIDSDCASGTCGSNGTCQPTPECTDNSQCSSGICGSDGTCQPKPGCASDSECPNGKCVNNACTTTPKSSTGLIILLIGLFLSLISGGYIAYNTYFVKPKASGLPPPIFSRPATAERAYPGQAQLTEQQKQKMVQRKEQRNEERKSVLKGFDNQLKTDDLTESGKPVQYVNLDEISKKPSNIPKNAAKADIFSKLADIAGIKSKDAPTKPKIDESGFIDLSADGKAIKQSDQDKSIKQINQDKSDMKTRTKDKTILADISQQKPDKSPSGSLGSRQQAMPISEAKSSPKTKKLAKKKEVFEKLEGMAAKYTPEEMTGKIAELSGKAASKVSSLLSYDSLSAKQATSLFDNLDKAKLTSDVFKDILSHLILSGKLSKETVSGILFDYMDKEMLSKKDVAKIMSDLKLI